MVGLSTSPRPCFDLASTLLRPRFDLVSTLFRPCFDLVSTWFRPCFDHVSTLLGPYWTLSDPIGPYWTLLDPTGPYWTLLNPTGRFTSCPHGGRGKKIDVFLAVPTVVGENILDVRILEKMTNHFLRNPYKRPEILSDGIMIRTNPGTFVRIP